METISKEEIRSEIKKKRISVSMETVSENSRFICDRLMELPEFRHAKIVFAYMDHKNEVQTANVIEQCWTDKKTVAVPKIFGKEMRFFSISSYEDLETGSFGILEPKEAQCPEIIFNEGLMLMPGVAFDIQRHRIGFGAGYYDRYLRNCPDIKKIALAFEFQIFEKIPFESFDIGPDLIITEKRIII